MKKRSKIITVKIEGSEQTWSLSDVGATRPLTVRGWLKRLIAKGYTIDERTHEIIL